jgi:hypothetical protein
MITLALTLHRVADEHGHAASVVRDEVHPVLDGPPERGHGPPHPPQQHLCDEGDEDGPPPPALGDLGADGAVDSVVFSDVAGAQEVEQVAEADLVRTQHHEVAEEVTSHVHDRRASGRNDEVARALPTKNRVMNDTSDNRGRGGRLSRLGNAYI